MSQILTAQVREKRQSFLSRQFAVERTAAQDHFDIAFGAVLPVLCFLFDPIVFKGGVLLGGPPLWGEYQVFTYFVSSIEIAALLIWLIMRRQIKSFSGPISGILILGGLFSFAIGVVILPFSVMGLIFLIGAAGFTPFLTAFVYFRNGIRGFRSHEHNAAYESRYLVAFASAVMALALPLFVSMKLSQTVSSSMNALLDGDVAQAEVAANRLKWLPFVPDAEMRKMVVAYGQESNPAKKDWLRRAYKDLTGEDIEHRLAIIND